MSLSLTLTPGGHLKLEEAPDTLPLLSDRAQGAIERAFGRSTAEGLIFLASRELDEELPAAFVFWRGIARDLFAAICRLGEGAVEAWARIEPPQRDRLEQLATDAPPMKGLEYLTADVLSAMWDELRRHVAAEAQAHPEGPSGFLRGVNPLWHLVGRVTFHLAENRRNAERPFAFLATFTHTLSGQTRLKHLPLAEALKTYAGSQDAARLEQLLAPVRRAAERSGLVRELLESRALFAPQSWTVGEAHRFLIEAPAMEEAGVVVRVPDWWSARRPPRPQVEVRIGSQRRTAFSLDELLDLSILWTIDGEPLTEDEKRQLMAGADGLVLLRGKWVEVNREQLNEVLDHWQLVQESNPDGLTFVQGMRLLAGTPLDGRAEEASQTLAWSRITAGGWLRETLERIRSPENVDTCQPGRDLAATLRPYQADGVRWLWLMTELGLGACLADDMGLGKTIQVIDLLLQRKRARVTRGRPSLLIVPASLVGNWRQELARFAPDLSVFFAHRSESSADQFDRIARAPAVETARYDLVISTYGLARTLPWMQEVNWSLVILDEAQAIKNPGSAQAKSVKKLKSACRIVLTGTPMENHLGELWSLFDFCCHGLLGSAQQFKRFVKRLNDEQDAAAFGGLRRLVKPYILRRLKTDPSIVPDLPQKTEMRTECVLSRKQAALYQRTVDELKRRLKSAEGMARRGLVLSVLMQLKQICNHPSQHLGQVKYDPADSGKFERLALLCEPIAERQEKVLVFTQFQAITQPLAEFLAHVFGGPGLLLHGGIAVGRRSELVKQFQDEAGPPFFVISLKAGGSGLNLTAASHVVHFDRWWNPAVENQATDRAFRIGQKRNVLVHKFICRGTLEERIDQMISEKQALADRLLDQGGETLLTEMNNEELLRFVSLDAGKARADD
jgi:non-specific serine/threonine protein kinase